MEILEMEESGRGEEVWKHTEPITIGIILSCKARELIVVASA